MSARNPVAFMSVKTQFDNLGDVLINRELALALSRRAETHIDFSRCPAPFRQAMAVDGLPNVNALEGLGSLKLFLTLVGARLQGRPCYYFLNPGGLGGREMSVKQTISASVYNLLLKVFAILGVRVCLVGASFDPLKPRSRRVMRSRLASLFLIAVRDRLSIGHLQHDGLRVDGLVPDLSFLSFEPSPAAAAVDRRAVAFSFRFDKGDETEFDAFVLDVAERHRGRPLKFVAQVERDSAPMERLCQRVADKGFDAQFTGCWTDLGVVNRSYADCAAIYSNRLHALLMATFQGATPIAVVKGDANRKIEGIFADLGLASHVHRLGEALSPHIVTPEPLAPDLLLAEKKSADTFFDRLFAGEGRAEVLGGKQRG